MKKTEPTETVTETGGDVLLTRKEVADRWKRHEETVSRAHSKGLKVIRFGYRTLRYRLPDVLAFEAQCQ